MSQTKEEWNAYMRDWRKTPAYKRQTQSAVWKWGTWRNNLRQRYSITPEQVGIMFLDQQGKCALCFKDIHYNVWGIRGDKTFSIHIDHDHKTGKIRGLLCQNCNIALGKFNDDKDTIQRALSYIQTQ